MKINRKLHAVIFVGPMKAGTSWLYEYLSNSSELILPNDVKETFFFDRHFLRGGEWYLSHFSSNLANLPIVEIAPSYFPNKEVSSRIRLILPEAKIVVTLRNPVKRAWSHYLHLRRYGYTRKSLREAIVDFPQILGASKYNECLQQWSQHFDINNISVLWQEDMIKDLDEYAKSVCDALGIRFLPVTGLLRSPSNEAAVAPIPTLATAGRRVAYALRDRGLYRFVNFAKKLGLKNIFFGTPGAKPLPKLQPEDEIWLRDRLQADYNSLPKRFRHPDVVV